jgi:Tol biopolymer transport system component
MTGRSRTVRALRPGIVLGLLAAVLFPLCTAPAYGQFFGQNKVQYKDFKWGVLRTQHFDVYYYKGEEQAVYDAALMAERGYLRLSLVLNHQIKARVPLVLYASHTDFEQTNITPELLGIGTGGVTEFLKRRVFLPFTGSYGDLDHVLTHELVHAFQVDILFGEGQNNVVGNPFAAQIPTWFMEGMAEYLSIGTVDPNTQMWLRDAALEGYLINIRTLGYVGDIRVYRFGQSIFAFFADTYGVAKIGEWLKKTHRFGSVEKALESTAGLSLDVLSKKWTESLRKTYLPEIVDYDSPTKIASQLTDAQHDMANFNMSPSVSPTGLQFVYISDKSMYSDVYLASALDGKNFKKLVEGERTPSFETLRFFNTSISWSPDESKIALPAKVGGEDALYIIEVSSAKVLHKYKFGLDAIYSPTWSPDGSKIAFVGLTNGHSTLSLCDADGKNFHNLLKGRYAVRDPIWSPDGTKIAYVTDQGQGTDVSKLIFGPLRLAIYDMATGGTTIPPAQEGKNISPAWSPDGRSLLFVSDRTGISNIYRMDLATGESIRLTNLLTGVSGLTAESPCLSMSREGNRILFTAFHRGSWDVYSVHDPKKFLEAPPALDTARRIATTSLAPLGTQEVAAAGAVESSSLPSRTPAPTHPAAPGGGSSHGAPITIEPKPPAEGAITSPDSDAPPDAGSPPTASTAADSTTAAGTGSWTDSTFAARSTAPADSASAAGSASSPAPPAPDSSLASSNRLVRTAPDSTAAPTDSTLSDYVQEAYRAPLADSTTFLHLPYKVTFSRDFFTGGAVVASNVGFAGSSVISFSDLLGNHTIYALLNLYGSLSNSDIYLSYANLAHRTNWALALYQYQKDLLLFSSPQANDVENQTYRGGAFSLSRPFNRFRRLEYGIDAAEVQQKVLRYDYVNGTVRQVSENLEYFYVAPTVSLIADNALYGNTGPIAGGRSRYTLEHAIGGVTYTTFVYDWRSYTNIHQRYTFAKRLLGGASFGKDPQVFRFGGPFTYRGVDYGDLQGTRAFIGSLEFRFPLIEQLRTGFLSLSLGGINGVLFMDAASAWTASSQPVFFTNVGGFHTQNLNIALGFGARINLGYFILRYDHARQHSFDGWVGPPMNFIAFGPEF